jgi:precorrin-8X/cobalt-precorrin-8 methylmutase
VLDYIRDGAEIYRRSFATIRQEADLSAVPPDAEKLAVRIAHASGMVDVIPALRFSPNAGALGRKALNEGAPILCDTAAVERGITRSRLPSGNSIALVLPGSLSNLANAVVAIGTDTTLLHAILDAIDAGAPAPSLLLAFPPGFEGADQAKAALAASPLPFVTVAGTRGGSAMAVAAVNALGTERE